MIIPINIPLRSRKSLIINHQGWPNLGLILRGGANLGIVFLKQARGLGPGIAPQKL